MTQRATTIAEAGVCNPEKPLSAILQHRESP